MVKMSILPKAIYRLNTIPIKIPMALFHRVRTNTSKIYMEPQKTPNSNSDFEKEEHSGRITQPNIRLYYKAIISQTAWYWHKNRHVD